MTNGISLEIGFQLNLEMRTRPERRRRSHHTQEPVRRSTMMTMPIAMIALTAPTESPLPSRQMLLNWACMERLHIYIYKDTLINLGC